MLEIQAFHHTWRQKQHVSNMCPERARPPVDRPFLPSTQRAFLRIAPSSCPQAGTTRSSPRSFRPAQEAWEGFRVLVSPTEPGKEQSQAEPQSAGCLTFSRELGGQHGEWLVDRNLPPLCHRVPRPALRTIPGFHRQPHRPRILSLSPWLHLNILEARTQGHIIPLQK